MHRLKFAGATTVVMLALVVTWTIAPQRDVTAQPPQNDPFGADNAAPFGADTAAPFGADTAAPFGADTAAPFGADTAAPFGADTADPFGAGPASPGADPFGGEGGYDPGGGQAGKAPSAEKAKPPQSRRQRAADPFAAGAPQGEAQDIRPPSSTRPFQIELTVVADDGLSYRKVQLAGRATVIPKGTDALPEVRTGSVHEIASGYGEMGMEGGYGGEMGGYGGEMGGYGGEMGGYGGEMGGYGGADGMDDMSMGGGAGDGTTPWRGSRSQHEEIARRISWQAQIDWVRQTLQKQAELNKADVERLKQLIQPVLRAQYTDQLRRQNLELSVVEKRLEQLRSQLAQRAAATDSVVDFELRRLELEAGGFGLVPDANLGPRGGSPPGYSEGGMF